MVPRAYVDGSRFHVLNTCGIYSVGSSPLAPTDPHQTAVRRSPSLALCHDVCARDTCFVAVKGIHRVNPWKRCKPCYVDGENKLRCGWRNPNLTF